MRNSYNYVAGVRGQGCGCSCKIYIYDFCFAYFFFHVQRKFSVEHSSFVIDDAELHLYVLYPVTAKIPFPCYRFHVHTQI